MKTNRLIRDYLNELFPNPRCELNYNTDYQLLISIVLSAQSTDKRVNSCTDILYKRYDSIYKLKNADLADIKNIIRPIGSFNKKAVYVKKIATILVDKYNGIVPRDRTILESFPGVGRKTVNVFLSEYYNEPAIAVDTHVNRISKRLAICNNFCNVREVEEKLMNFFPKEDWAKVHLQLVLFGRYKCKAKRPVCRDCQLIDICKEKNKNLI